MTVSKVAGGRGGDARRGATATRFDWPVWGCYYRGGAAFGGGAAASADAGTATGGAAASTTEWGASTGRAAAATCRGAPNTFEEGLLLLKGRPLLVPGWLTVPREGLVPVGGQLMQLGGVACNRPVGSCCCQGGAATDRGVAAI